MNGLPHALYRAEQVRELDRIAIEEHGIASEILMERAGAAAFAALRDRYPSARSVVTVCGSGNNGGDGYVVARLARESGLSAAVFSLGEPRGTAAEAAARWGKTSSVERWRGQPLEPYDVVVDAVVGTGLDRDLTGEYLAAVEAINASGRPVVALDIPSGLSADTGHVLGAAVQAEMTVTFIGLKQGMFTGSGRRYCGRIRYDSLDVPPDVFSRVPAAATRLWYDAIRSRLPPRLADAHKGNFGHVLVVGGDTGMMGAVMLAGEAALRAGAGLVTIATRASHSDLISANRPELMVHAVEDGRDLARGLERATVIAIGPGLGRSAWSQGLLGAVLEAHRPLVIDADALNLLAAEPAHREDWVMTPHPGEAARLLQRTPAEVERDRFAAARALRERYGGVVVLKGAGTLICSPSRDIEVCDGGNPGMASGGVGDALTGVIAGLVAQRYSLAGAAGLGVVLHAEAGDRAARNGERGLIASDLIVELRSAANPATRY